MATRTELVEPFSCVRSLTANGPGAATEMPHALTVSAEPGELGDGNTGWRCAKLTVVAGTRAR